MPSHYGFLTAAEYEEKLIAENEAKHRTIFRIHPLISTVLNDFITTMNIPSVYMNRVDGEWYIYLNQLEIYRIKVVQDREILWLEYEDAELIRMSKAEEKKYIQENSEKLPGVLSLITGLEVKRTGVPKRTRPKSAP